MTGAVLSAGGLRKAYPLPRTGLRRRGEVVAVDDVGLRLCAGEAVGLVGTSGSGKTTLARLLARLVAPDAGRILLDGQDIAALSPGRFARLPARRAVQMVFQDATGSLNPRFRVFDLIADPLRVLAGARGPDLAAQVQAAAQAAGLTPEMMGRRPGQLSGGQKARVGIARALAVAPRVLILDEPTASLDAPMQAGILHLLDRLRRERGMALLFVSHDLHVVRLLCQRVLVMQAGRIVEQGPVAQVFGAPRHPCTRALLAALPSGLAGSATAAT